MRKRSKSSSSAKWIFCESEKKLLKILGRRKMTVQEITEKFFNGKAPGKNNNVAGLIRRIVTKCQLNDLPWTLNGEGTGRAGRTVWREYVKSEEGEV